MRNAACCRHTHRFLFVYLTFLPVALWPLYEWFTLPIMAVLTLLLVGLENIGGCGGRLVSSCSVVVWYHPGTVMAHTSQ